MLDGFVPGRLALAGPTSGHDPCWPDRRVAWWVSTFLVLGVVLRLTRFCLVHPLWKDEAFLVANLIDRDYRGLMRPLDFAQVCPIFFLWAERAIGVTLGWGERSLRLLPTVASVAGLFLFAHLAGRLLRGWAVVLAVAILAVGFTPIRYGGEVKPYSVDFLAATGLIALAVEWLRAPGRVGWLWGMAAAGPPALAASNPSVFVAAGLGLALAVPVARTRSPRAIAPFVAFGVGSAVTFLVLLRAINAPQGEHVMSWMQLYWKGSFPPRSLPALLAWLPRVHTGYMFAYPFGGDRGASTATTVLVVAGVVAYLRRGSRTVLAVLLAPFGLGMVAAALRRYPYGGSARTMQYVAPAIILLAGLGGAALVARVRRAARGDRVARGVLLGLGAIGVGMLGWDVSHPYHLPEEAVARDFARRFWREESAGAELLCARTDLHLPLNPLVWQNNRAALYLCHQAIYSPRHRAGAPPRLDRVGATHPLRVVLFNGVPGDEALMARWAEDHRGRYRLRATRQRVLNPGLLQVKAPAEDRYCVYEFVPAEGAAPDKPPPQAIRPRRGSLDIPEREELGLRRVSVERHVGSDPRGRGVEPITVNRLEAQGRDWISRSPPGGTPLPQVESRRVDLVLIGAPRTDQRELVRGDREMECPVPIVDALVGVCRQEVHA